MSPNTDLRALRLVADEVNLGLDLVGSALKVLDDAAQVLACTRELNRLRGAFGMADAPGLARFVEALAAAITAAATATDQRAQRAVTIERALDELRRCLKDALRTGSLPSLDLFSSYVELKLAIGDDKVNASDLFYPTLKVARVIEDSPLIESDEPSVARHTRIQYQRAMLAWLKGDANAISEMMRAVRTLDHVFGQVTHFWWVAGGFLEVIEGGGIKLDSHLKRVCARIDLQMSRVTHGGHEISDALLREILFYIGQSMVETPQVAEIRQAFGLSCATVSHDLLADTYSTRQIIHSLVREVQQRYSAFATDAGTDCQALQGSVDRLVLCAEGFRQPIVQTAVEAIRVEAAHLSADQATAAGSDSVRLAHLLLALEQLLADDNTESALVAKLETLLDGSADVAEGSGSWPAVGASLPTGSASSSLVREMHQCLRQIEAAIDSAQADVSRTDPVSIAKPLRQVAAAFVFDGHVAAEQILRHAEMLIAGALAAGCWDRYIVEIADCLGALDLYVDALPTDGAQAVEVLAPILRSIAVEAANDDDDARSVEKPSVSVEDVIEIERREVETLLHNWQQNTELVVSEIKTHLEAIHQNALIVADQDMSERSAHALTLLQNASSDINPQLRRVAEAVGRRVGEPSGMASAAVDVGSDAEVLEVFLEEVAEIAQTVSAIIAQHQHGASLAALGEIRRAFHTLKGSSGVAGLSHMAKVAWVVERQLNAWLDQNRAPSASLQNAVAEVIAAFSIWRQNLAESGATVVDVDAFTRRFAQLTPDAPDAALEARATVAANEVQTRREPEVSDTLFGIFVAEASQRIDTLRNDFDGMRAGDLPRVSSLRAAHTLAGIANTVKIESIATLAAAGERWLGRLLDSGTTLSAASRALLGDLIESLGVMFAAVDARGQPLPDPSLCRRLEVATSAAAHASSTAPAGSDESTSTAVPASKALADALLCGIGPDILSTFLDEAHELGSTLARGLLAWREAPAESCHAEAVARCLHTLKGSARAAGALTLGDFAHNTEERVLASLLGEAFDASWLSATLEWVDVWLSHIEELRATSGGAAFVESPPPREEGGQVVASGQLRIASSLVERLLESAGEMGVVRSRAATEVKAVNQGVVDIKDSIVRLRQQLREIEIQAESQMSARLTLLDEANDEFDPLEFDRFTRLQELTRLMAESLHDITAVQQNLLRNLGEVRVALDQQERLGRGMHGDLMRVYAVPFANIEQRLQRVVRQTAQTLGKQVDLRIHGAQIEIDRTLLDRVVAPFEHLLRNAVAHGIEVADDRERAGKDETGHIDLFLHQEANRIRIEVVDDGAGLDLKRILRKAEESGLLVAGADVDERHVSRLIFTPGLSTADTVTEIAGRGIGMDAVRSTLAGLGGDIDVQSVRGRGTRFTLHLPLTVMVVSVLSVVAGGRAVAVPSTMVRHVQRMNGLQLRALYELKHAEWQGESYPFHYLGQLLGDAASAPISEGSNVVLMLGNGTRRAAILVDSLTVNQDITLKDMGPQLGRIASLTGATVTGGGRVLLVVDPLELQARMTLRQSAPATTNAADEQRPLVLVVDDSITVRKVTSRLMERAGYRVAVAKDGVEGLEVLHSARPDVILLDIEMPRMDGFEFTKHLRADAATQGLPIIMISSRTADKHRIHAEQLGVNLFLGKPFQDDQLLAAVADFTRVTSSQRTGT